MGNDRVLQIQKRAVFKRLGTGSAYLGDAWRNGHRCGGGWTGSCPCGDVGMTPFCKGKVRWVALLLQLHNGHWPYELTGQEEFAIIEAMTITQFAASGLTARVEVPGAELPLRFGRKGTYWWTLLDLALTVPGEERQSAFQAVQKIQTTFAA